MGEAGLGQRLDQADLVGGRDRPRLDLEALARAFLVDGDVFRQIGHGFSLAIQAVHGDIGSRLLPDGPNVEPTLIFPKGGEFEGCPLEQVVGRQPYSRSEGTA